MQAANRPTHPLDALWQAPVLIWVVVAGEGLAAVLTLAPDLDGNHWVYFGLTSMFIQWVSLLTLGVLYLLRRPLGELRPQLVAYLALGMLILCTWAGCALAWLLLRDSWSMTRVGWQMMFLRFTGISITVGLLALAAFQNHWRARQLAVRAKQSELEALHARIRPHFLFNTLNTGAALVHMRPAAAEQLLLDLADLFRAALAGPRQISLQEELALAQRYLEIESLRFGDRLEVHWKMLEPLPAVSVPTLSIQPLVENAIRHGIEPSPEPGRVEVEVTREGGNAVVTVRNTLPGPDRSGAAGHRVGIPSVNARIDELTQGRGSLSSGREGDLYVARLLLPLDPEQDPGPAPAVRP